MDTRDIEMQIEHGRGQVIGYRRVSSHGQNLDRQDLPKCDKIFEEKMSGATTDRPELQKLMEFVRDGDTVVVHSIDRLARSLKDLEQIVDTLVEKGVSVKFLSEGLTFSQKSEDAAGRLMLQVLGAIGQFERTLLRNRQQEGIEKAKDRGVYKGRRPKVDKQLVWDQWERDRDQSIKDISLVLDYSRSSVQRALSEYPPYQQAPKRVAPTPNGSVVKRMTKDEWGDFQSGLRDYAKTKRRRDQG